MAFPKTPLGLACELQLAGTWTDITGYAVEQGSPPAVPLTACAITRGRADETASATPSSCAVRLNNNDGRFSPRNPTGPYYPNLTRNTPLRVSVPDSGTYLRLEDDTVSYVSAPDSVSLQLTSYIDVRVDCQPSSYMPCVLAAKWGAAARSWALAMNGDGTLAWYWYDGTTVRTVTSAVPVPLGRAAVRALFQPSGLGTLAFFTAPAMAGAFTQLGPSVNVSASAANGAGQAIAAGYSATMAASYGYGGLAGKVYEVQVLNSVPALVADPVFTSATPGAATLADAQGNVWTLNGTAAFSNRAYRFHGECASLPQEWDVTGHEVWTPLTASGPLRRLQQGSTPVKSVMRRGVTSFPSGPSGAGTLPAPQTTLAYWPCEDPAGSTQIASGIAVNGDGVRPGPMMLSGLPAFQATSGSPSADGAFACSAQLPQVGSSRWTGFVPSYSAAATAWSVEFLLTIPSGGLGANAVVFAANMAGAAGVGTLQLQYQTGSGGSLILQVVTPALTTALGGPAGVNGQPLWIQIANVSTGGTQSYLTVLQPGGVPSGFAGGSDMGHLTSVVVNPAAAALGATEAGHIWASAAFSANVTLPAALPAFSSAALQNLLKAYAGEPAATRVARLAAENGYQARIYGYPAVTALMGAQAVDTLANVLQACEDADRGQIFEPRACLGLGYRTLASMCNQAPAVTLDFASPADEISPPLLPVDDDQFIRNDVTASRSGGSSAEVQVTSGPLSVNPPPAGAGPYATSQAVSCAYDSQLPHIAGWMAHAGTADAERFPAVTVDLASTDAAITALLPAVRDADIGARAVMVNPPGPWLPPDQVTQLLWGAAEQLGDFAWRIAWNAVPEIPYQVAAAGTAHADTAGSQLHAGVTAAAVSLTVDVTAGNLWTTSAGDFPFLVRVAGEVMKVTNITGAGSPQTFTVARAQNGVSRAQAAGAVIHADPQPAAALSGAA